MADFSNKKIRALFEEGGLIREAGAEDLALTIALAKPLLAAALKRVQELSQKDNVVLDPLPIKPPSPPTAKSDA